MSLQTTMNGLLKDIDLDVERKLDTRIGEFESKLSKKLDEVDQKIISGVSLKIEFNNKTATVKGLKHGKFKELLIASGQRMPVMLVGSAGTGKTHAGKQVSEALGLDFYSMSVGAQTSKSDIVGYMDANGQYVPTAFRRAIENGGVFVMDEIDAGNSNVTIMLNSALSNGYMSFPDKMVQVHKDFIFIATANTYGQGANREYVGRNQLDAATLDRFIVIDWTLDTRLEKNLVKEYENGERWLKVVEYVRQYADENRLRALITPRTSIHGARLLDSGMDFNKVVTATILKSIPEKSWQEVEIRAKETWQLEG